MTDPKLEQQTHIKALQAMRENYATNAAILLDVPTLVAALDASIAALSQQRAGWSLRMGREGVIEVIGPDGRCHASIDSDIAKKDQP